MGHSLVALESLKRVITGFNGTTTISMGDVLLLMEA